MSRGSRVVILLAASCALLAAALWIDGVFLARWQSRTELVDLNGDGRTEELILSGRRMRILKDGRELWTTECGWKAADFLTGDIDGDGSEELLLLVWKRGSYGNSRPFWVARDEFGYSQHIFLFRLNGERVTPLWMSSRLKPEVREWELLPDGLRIVTPAGEETLWGWQGWGLVRLDGEEIPY